MDSESSSSSNTFSSAIADIFSTLWDVWKEMFGAFFEVLPKILNIALWFLCGLFILPCVFVAGTLYPLWTEWGEDL